MLVIVAVTTFCAVFQQIHSQGLFGNFFKGGAGGPGILNEGLDGIKTVIGKDGPLHHAVDTTYHGARHVADKVLARGPCERDLTLDYRIALYNFHTKMYKQVAEQYSDHFVISPYSIWLSIAALAEGADDSIQKQLFEVLELPDDLCARQQFYQLALSAETPGPDVNLIRKRALILDASLTVNSDWSEFVKSARILDVKSGPMRNNPIQYSDRLREFINAKSNPVLSGNSYIIDSLDYDAFWTIAFSEAKISREPFYDDAGAQVGMVDMMRMTKKIRMAHVPTMKVKVMELPVGNDGRYTMILTVGLDKATLRNAIKVFVGKFMVNILQSLQMSLIPIEIAVPRFALASEFDVRKALEGVGIDKFWTDPAATRYISSPPAMPTGYLQRVSVEISSKGIQSAPQNDNRSLGFLGVASNTATGLSAALGRDFIANRPFMFSLFDTKSRTCLYSGAFSKPTHR